MSVTTFRAAKHKWTYIPEHAQAQLPRYTSYPPANRFTGEIEASHAAAAIAALPQKASLSLYLHIPFCQKLCWYCGCHTSVPTIADPVEPYVQALISEIEMVGRISPADACVNHIHFGGGSPDILTPGQIGRLFNAIRSSFVVARFAEIAAELDPRGASYDVINAFANNGLTRASLGVQVIDPDVQKRINRLQTEDQITSAVRLLRAAGVTSLNLDMMYGLPGQTREHVIETALFIAGQDADRVATFGYAHVPWMKKHQNSIDTAELASGEERFRQAEIAASTLEAAGYMAIGFDHFAAPGDSLVTAEREGRLRRNFQGYTDDDALALIGFGASSISSLPGLTYQNTPDTSVYKSQVLAGRMPVVRGVAPTADDQRTGKLIERVLCEFEVDVPADLLIHARSQLLPLINAGLAQLSGTHLTVSENGRPYVRNIAACFDPAFAQSPNRHSLAI
ncbi:MAG: oxygen-independent coproporphyrinogen III oxidase [Alphaproteobacteria bacterium]|nr:MAG: oxygen-independent coproporphyrinogen III oxidase [Alphaproteobacteria bacterium]